jgi:hypothetical protein
MRLFIAVLAGSVTNMLSPVIVPFASVVNAGLSAAVKEKAVISLLSDS